jgi:hypothetical protein
LLQKDKGAGVEDKKVREIAISRYEKGESPKEIYTDLEKSKSWFFKWLKRYKLEESHWSESRSRRPRKSPKKTPSKIRDLVRDTRIALEKTKYSQIGAFSVSYHISKEGGTPPSVATINRIIKKEGLVRKKPKYVPKGKDYPDIEVALSNTLHQIDVVGPRYLKNLKFYSANIIDAYDRRVSVKPVATQNRIAIISSLLNSWQSLGIPKYLQLDNKLPSRGSNRYPHSFGAVIRLCLYMGIEPVFIPIAEPWRNGIIEHFQNVFDKAFFRTQVFDGYSNLYKEAKVFEVYHNDNHRYSTLKGRFPNEAVKGSVKLLDRNFELPAKLIIHPGYVHLVRFIRSNRTLDIFGEKYILPIEYEYVMATIDTSNEMLKVFLDDELIEEFPYHLPKSCIELSKIDL